MYNVTSLDPGFGDTRRYRVDVHGRRPRGRPPGRGGSGDTVYAATTRGTVYAIQPGGLGNPGTQLWSCPVGGPVQGGLAVYNGVAYVGCD